MPLVESCSVFLGSCSLLGSHFKGTGKEIWGVREGQEARKKGVRKEGGRRGGKHLEGVVILLLEVASCHRNLSGYPVVMLPQVDNLTEMLKRSGRHKTSEGVLPI